MISDAADIISNDFFVDHPRGRIFTRTWKNSRVHQEKAPIVLLHDSLGCVDLWRDFPALLSAATGRMVIAYDRLGFGKSDPREDRLALDFIADEAKTFFPVIGRRLGFRNFIAFGHSVGGGMAVNCAAEYASDCIALITESAQTFASIETLQGILAAKQQFKDESQLERLKKYHGEKAKWVLDAWTETWLDPQFTSWSLNDILPRVTCPVLAIHGVFDEYGSTQHPKMIGQLCSGTSQVEIMENTYHVPHKERPQAVIDLASDFISSLPPR
ncbi:alpha/beta fold hydrolase [Herbaspirillum sp. GCM10030257]|uniref:alpha/beta fold hydrolase n=1 Tax=Herbaspirillum sp. GCM10030257 TaxID=3273393 RepID=UPI00361F00A4